MNIYSRYLFHLYIQAAYSRCNSRKGYNYFIYSHIVMLIIDSSILANCATLLFGLDMLFYILLFVTYLIISVYLLIKYANFKVFYYQYENNLAKYESNHFVNSFFRFSVFIEAFAWIFTSLQLVK
jgi:hypothetical protein